MPRTCSVVNCPVQGLYTLHEVKCPSWISFLKPQKLPKKAFICSFHFKQSDLLGVADFMAGQRKFISLVEDACPEYYLTRPCDDQLPFNRKRMLDSSISSQVPRFVCNYWKIAWQLDIVSKSIHAHRSSGRFITFLCLYCFKYISFVAVNYSFYFFTNYEYFFIVWKRLRQTHLHKPSILPSLKLVEVKIMHVL